MSGSQTARYNRRSMADNALLPSEPIVDAAGRIAGDLPCVTCGYNLNTLAEAARCPECGTPVQRSTTYHLRPSLGWLKVLGDGVNLLTTGTVVMVIGAALVGLGGLLLDGLRGASQAVPLLVLAFVVVGTVAVIRITTAEPAQLARRRERLSWRRMTRLCLLLTILSPILMTFAVISRYAWSLLLVLLPVVALPSAFSFHMAALMRRVLRPDLARAARRLAFACPLAVVACVAWYRIAVFVPLRFSRPLSLSQWGAVFGALLVLGALVALGFIFMVRAGRALTAAQHRAEYWLSGSTGAGSTDRDPSRQATRPGD
jgi:hypothetical protein